jgi:chromosome segregation ATPase
VVILIFAYNLLLDLQAKLAAADAALSKQKIELDEQRDRDVVAARVAEQEKAELTISDLRQRAQSYLSTRNELEARCDGYMREIKSLQDEHKTQVTGMQNHITSLETEIQRQRAQNTASKDTISALEVEVKMRSKDLDDAKRK